MEADRPVERAMSDAPKSAFELAMEKLKKKDAEAGVEAQVLTDAQRAEIAEAKSPPAIILDHAADGRDQLIDDRQFRRRQDLSIQTANGPVTVDEIAHGTTIV